MTTRRAALAALLLLATFALYYLNRGTPPQTPRSTEPAGNTGSAGGKTADSRPVGGGTSADKRSVPSESAQFTASPAYNPADFPIAAPLNAPNSTIQRDLDILNQVFEAWRSNFPREGNPVGENRDITRALAGENRIRFALIPPKHPAINASGELCDRWGTPFRFHQISGEEMEIRSAGPDRRFATEDDALWTPAAGGFQKTP